MAGTSRQFPRQFDGGQLIVASHNEGKVAEITALLAPFGLDVVSAASLGLAEPEEIGTSFIENAELKARAACLAADLPALADDSGLAIAALGGAPGIYSARWAGPSKDFAAAMQRVEHAVSADARARRNGHMGGVLWLTGLSGSGKSTLARVITGLLPPSDGQITFDGRPLAPPLASCFRPWQRVRHSTNFGPRRDWCKNWFLL